MNKKYCLIPDEEKFYSFLASMTFSPVELMQLKLMHINQICVDESACQWEVHFSCAAHLTGGLLQKAAQQLAAAFSLQSVVAVILSGSFVQQPSGSGKRSNCSANWRRIWQPDVWRARS